MTSVGQLRTRGFAARRSLSGPDRASAEDAIVAHLSSLQCLRNDLVSTVGGYLADDGEPALDALFDRCRADNTGLALPVPAVDGNAMSFRPWLADDDFESGRFGIPVPPERPAVVPDVFLVPLVCFDSAGNRVGRGAGFYDRYLSENDAGPGNGAITVGVAFEAQRVPAIDPTPTDVPLDVIVTELGIRLVRPIGAK